MPLSFAWRMNHIEQKADRAHTLAVTANEVLARAGIPNRIPAETFTALQHVAANIRAERRRVA